MSARSWGDVWNLTLQLMSREPIFLQIVAWLGVALFAVMALDGLRSNFFPRRAPPSKPLEPPGAEPEIVAPPQMIEAEPASLVTNGTLARFAPPKAAFVQQPVHQMVNRPRAFRSSPRQTRVLGTRKPSA